MSLADDPTLLIGPTPRDRMIGSVTALSTHLQRESLVSGLVLLVLAAGERADEGLEGGPEAPAAARRVHAARVSEARRVSVQTLLIPQLQSTRTGYSLVGDSSDFEMFTVTTLIFIDFLQCICWKSTFNTKRYDLIILFQLKSAPMHVKK